MAAPTLRHIAVAVDGSRNGEVALEYAIDLARHYKSELVVLSVAPIVPVYINAAEPFVPAPVPPTQLEQYRQIADAGVKKARAAGVASVSAVSYEGVVVDEILNHLDQHPVDLMVVGSRGLSTAKRILLGSVSTGVVTHAPCPVLVVRLPPTKKSSAA